uniref:Uncharacterized protein n=1 Tax=Arundo donax TaxID=35708 RepID=A0A0A9EMZ3_ARUDO
MSVLPLIFYLALGSYSLQGLELFNLYCAYYCTFHFLSSI